MPDLDALKIRILTKLSSTHTNCRAFEWLNRYVEKNKHKLRDALEELYEEFKVRRKIIKKIEYYCLPINSMKSVKIGCSIYNSVSKAKKPLTAIYMAKKRGLDSNYVSRVCNRFKERGYISKGKPKEGKKKAYFAPITGEVVHAGNYERVKKLYQELHKIVSKFNLEDPRLEQNLGKSLESMQARKDLTKSKGSIKTFKKDLLAEVIRAEKKNEIRDALRIKPFYPKVSTWKIPK